MTQCGGYLCYETFMHTILLCMLLFFCSQQSDIVSGFPPIMLRFVLPVAFCNGIFPAAFLWRKTSYICRLPNVKMPRQLSYTYNTLSLSSLLALYNEIQFCSVTCAGIPYLAHKSVTDPSPSIYLWTILSRWASRSGRNRVIAFQNWKAKLRLVAHFWVTNIGGFLDLEGC